MSSIPHRDVNRLILQSLPRHGYQGRTALAAHTLHDARALEEAGADIVLLPFADAADQAVDRLLAEDPAPDTAPSHA